jgi:hypothetical protein
MLELDKYSVDSIVAKLSCIREILNDFIVIIPHVGAVEKNNDIQWVVF